MLSTYDESEEFPKNEISKDRAELLESDTFLDKCQKAAISSCLDMDLPIVAVPGPPGSGKTTALIKSLELLAHQVFFN